VVADVASFCISRAAAAMRSASVWSTSTTSGRE
jgi:hypothetical protein